MARNLKNLIIASGYSGVAGQSFRNHVTGSGTGTTMSDYNMGDGSWTNTPVQPPTASVASIYSLPTLKLGLSTFNSKAGAIQNKTTSAWGTSYLSPNSNASASITSVTWASNTASLSLTLFGELTIGTPTITLTNWYDTYTIPYSPFATTIGPPYQCTTETDCSNCTADCNTSYTVRMTFAVGGVPASGSSDNSLYVTYTPDNFSAGYNPTVYGPGPTGATSWTITQDRQAGNTPTITSIEWATDSGFTSVVSTTTSSLSSSLVTFSSISTTTATYYIRYKLDGAESWTEYASNPVTWSDPRTDI